MMSCWVKMEEEFGFGFGWEKDMRRIVEEWRKGPWSGDEDKLLTDYVQLHGEGRWNCVARLTGLKRNGKSCRLRWVNYLRPDLKRSQITPNEETIILDLHARWGNRWSTIARSLPGRTDNEIKNYWRTHFKNKSSTVMPLTPFRRNSHDKIKARLLLKKQQFQQQSEDMKSNLWQQQQQQLDDQTSNTQSHATILPAAAPPPPVQMPTTYDYSTLILNNIPQLQHDDDNDDMFWDTVSLWNQLQEIDLYATQSSSTALHQTHSSSFSL